MRRAVLLDRDGTLNVEASFVTRARDLVVLPHAAEAVRRLHRAGFALVVLTNQSGVARGLYDEAELARIHARLHRELDGLPLAYLHCPHLPEAEGPYGGPCPCRKPGDGLLRQARELLEVDLERSFLVGDSARDLQMGRAFPLPKLLVQSGKPWQRELAVLQAAGCPPDAVLADVAAAAEWITARR